MMTFGSVIIAGSAVTALNLGSWRLGRQKTVQKYK